VDERDSGNRAEISPANLRLPKLSHLVASKLRTQIASGQISDGSRLPPENELLEIFRVSRPTLREALRILETESLITIGRGVRSGATVSAPSANKATEYAAFVLAASGVTILDLHQARTFFEPEIVRQITANRHAGDATRLRERLAEFKDALKTKHYAAIIKATNQFHETLAELSENRAVTLFIGILRNISDEVYSKIVANEASSSALLKASRRSSRTYAKLCDLVEAGDPAEAAAFWRDYMEGGLPFLIDTGIGNRPLPF
jgi:DNA-binding FadR family transcriptional regulator